MQAARQHLLGEVAAVPAPQRRPAGIGDDQAERIKIGEHVAVHRLACRGQQRKHAAGPPGLERSRPANAVEDAGDAQVGRRDGQPGSAGLQVAAADELRMLRPVPRGRLPWPVGEFVPDTREQQRQARLDAQHYGAHEHISADRRNRRLSATAAATGGPRARRCRLPLPRAAPGCCDHEDMDAVNLESLLARVSEHWAPKKIAELNDYDVKIVKMLGDFTWHRHADTDELFLVIDGRLTIQLRGGAVSLGSGELFVVPRGAEHCPRADVETAVLLIEPRSVINTGDAGGDLTAHVETLP